MARLVNGKEAHDKVEEACWFSYIELHLISCSQLTHDEELALSVTWYYTLLSVQHLIDDCNSKLCAQSTWEIKIYHINIFQLMLRIKNYFGQQFYVAYKSPIWQNLTYLYAYQSVTVSISVCIKCMRFLERWHPFLI